MLNPMIIGLGIIIILALIAAIAIYGRYNDKK